MNSQQLYERARRVTPGGVHSPVRSFKHVGGAPVYFEKAQGAYLWDTEGHRYTDFCLGFGPHLLGHSPPAVVAAVQEQASRAMTFGACHPGEIELCERVLAAYPFLDRVRLLNSGTEAVMTAVRVARGFAGRDKVVQFEGCYHGHSDGLLARAGSGVAFLSEASSQGVPASIVAETLSVRWELESVKRLFAERGKQIAAVLLEPVPANNGLWVPSRESLLAVVEAAREAGALVIFDEVICGFRLGPQGAAGFWDCKPDLVTLGKIVGGGLPLAAVVGRAEVMDRLAPLGGVYQAGTLSANPLAVAAGNAALTEIERQAPHRALAQSTREFATELERAGGARGLRVPFVASMFWPTFQPDRPEFPLVISPEAHDKYGAFFREALHRGVYLPPSPYEVGFLSTAHTPEILREALEGLRACLR